jgi:hypothetical protein
MPFQSCAISRNVAKSGRSANTSCDHCPTRSASRDLKISKEIQAHFAAVVDVEATLKRKILIEAGTVLTITRLHGRGYVAVAHALRRLGLPELLGPTHRGPNSARRKRLVYAIMSFTVDICG